MNKADKELIDTKFQAQTALIMSTQDIQNIRDENLKKTLNEILYNVRKTNGRVSDLESREVSHVINCPQIDEIKKIKENLFEYNIFKKYPKLTISVLLGTMFFSVMAWINSLK